MENVTALLTNIGFDENDISVLTKEEKIDDLSPFTEKVKGNFYDLLKSDNDFIESITKPVKDLSIGKEKQLKKQVRNYFGLKEDDLTDDKIISVGIDKIIERGLSKIKPADDKSTLNSEIYELSEQVEALKSQLLEKDNEVEKRITQFKKAKETDEELINLINADPLASKGNTVYIATAIKGFLSAKGIYIDIDEKKNLKLLANEIPAKDEHGNLLKINKVIKDFMENINPSTHTRGNSFTGSPNKETKEGSFFIL